MEERGKRGRGGEGRAREERRRGREGGRESESAWVPQTQDAKTPFGEVALGGNANSTGECKCKALRALCANIRPGSAAPTKLPGTSAAPRPALRA